MTRILITLLICCAVESEDRLLSSAGACPPSRVLHPCLCSDNRITCGQDIKYSIKHIFHELSSHLPKNERHFSAFVFENSAIEEFDDNMFADVLFDNITIINAINLAKIKKYAFNKTAKSVRHFEQVGQSKLAKRFVNQLFDALSSLVNVRHMTLELNAMKSFPSYAFTSDGHQSRPRVEWFDLKADSLTTIANYAFYELHNLRHIRLKADRLQLIAGHSFDFEMPSNHILNIDLRNNQLTVKSFEIEAFIGTKRPINLMLMFNRLTYLDENIFGPMLRSDPRNVIDLYGNPLICNCTMAWLLRDRDELQSQVRNAKCNELADIWSLEDRHFSNCFLDRDFAPLLVIRSQSFRANSDHNLIAIALFPTLLLQITITLEWYPIFGL